LAFAIIADTVDTVKRMITAAKVILHIFMVTCPQYLYHMLS